MTLMKPFMDINAKTLMVINANAYIIYMKYIALFLLSATVLTTSCIREDIPDCKALSLTLAVHDKNYANVGSVREETPLSETLQFRQYIPNWRWTLRNVETGEILEEQPSDTCRRDGQELELTFCDCIPYGTYVFTAYGKYVEDSQIDPKTGQVELHPNHRDDGDVYVSNDTIVYAYGREHHRSEMYRAKDELIIELENMPDSLYRATLLATSLYATLDPMRDPDPEETVDWRFWYSDTTYTEQRDALISATRPMKSILAPSVYRADTKLHLSLTPASPDGTPLARQPRDIEVTLDRNYITVVKYVYTPDSPDLFTIYVLINGAWESQTGLEVD